MMIRSQLAFMTLIPVALRPRPLLQDTPDSIAAAPFAKNIWISSSPTASHPRKTTWHGAGGQGSHDDVWEQRAWKCFRAPNRTLFVAVTDDKVLYLLCFSINFCQFCAPGHTRQEVLIVGDHINWIRDDE